MWQDLNSKLYKINQTEDIFKKQYDCLDLYLDAVRNSIQNILKTNQYEMVGRPEFGCDLRQFLFSMLDVETQMLIEEYVKTTLLKFEPRINVKEIDIIQDTDYNNIHIDIKFRIRNDATKTLFQDRVSFCCP